MTVDHNEDIDKEIRISSSIFWDIAIQGGNEVMRYLSNSFIYECNIVFAYGGLFLVTSLALLYNYNVRSIV